MCGRINVSDNDGVRLLLEMLGMDVWPSRDPRFNVAPSSALDVLIPGNGDIPVHAEMTWGLQAPWAKAGKSVSPLINARAETLFEKPTFRKYAQEHRIVIPVTGFYEWRREGKLKKPFFIKSANEPAMLLAGISQPAVHETDTCSACVVTTNANEAMSAVHSRMPVLLSCADVFTWLSASDQNVVQELLVPASNNTIHIEQVDDYVNSTRNQGSRCQEAIKHN